MHNLVIFCHNNHSFLLNEINYASNIFDFVYVVTLKNEELNNRFQDNKKVRLLFFEKNDLHIFGIKSLYKIFSTNILHEIFLSIKSGDFSAKYFKQLLLFLAVEKIYKIKFCEILKISKSNYRTFKFLSCWYECDAYAIYQLNKLYGEIKLYSLCHSFEVDKIKNPYILHMFRKEYHKEFSLVSFISKNVMTLFTNDVLLPLQLSPNNIEVRYLGTKKLFEGYSNFNVEPPFTIFTCSNIIPVKRVLEFYEFLEDHVDIPINWVHAGDGTQMNELKHIIERNQNNHLNIELLGRINNYDLHRYYVENNIDLFVNYSLSEGIPVTLMEAIAYGVPVIATNVGGNNEIVKSEFGCIFDANLDGEGLWKIIKEFLLMPISEKKKMSVNAYKFYNENFNSDKLRPSFYAKILE